MSEFSSKRSVTQEMPNFNGGERDDADKEPGHLGRKGVATAVAAAVLTVSGIVAGGAAIMGGESGPKKGPEKQPGASAPATPGEKNGGTEEPKTGETPGGTEPTDLPTFQLDYNNDGKMETYTAETVPLLFDTNGDGKMEEYKGVDGLAKAVSLNVEDFPTSQDAVRGYIARLNAYLNWGDQDVKEEYYEAPESKDGRFLGPATIANDYLDPAFQKGMYSEVQGTTLINNEKDAWMAEMVELRNQTAGAWAFSRDNDVTYKFTYDILEDMEGTDEGLVSTSDMDDKNLYTYWVWVNASDNSRESGSKYDNIDVDHRIDLAVQKQPAEDGTEAWKIVAVNKLPGASGLGE